jgi:hypothetical protein
MALTVAGLLLLTCLNASTTIPYILGCLVLLGAGFGIFSSPNTNAIISSVDRKSYGVASGMVGTMRLVGQMLSMGLAMTVFAIFIGRVSLELAPLSSFIDSIRVAFIIFFAMCLIGMVFSLVRVKKS